MRLERKYTELEKQIMVQTFMKSGDSMNHWCKENNLPHSTFHGWLQKYRNVQETNHFIEVEIPLQNMNRKSNRVQTKVIPTLSIAYHDFKIDMTGDIEPLLLEKVLKVVTTLNV